MHNTATNGTAELELDEEGTRISLTIVDTPGFGDQIDNEARSVESPYPKEQLLTCL
jgi:septin family protein